MLRNGTLYKQIINFYIESIKKGEVKPNEQILTEAELCDKFQVSRITVIRALKELQLMGYIYRIKGKGSFVADLNKINQNPKSKIIGLVVSYHEQLEKDFLDGLESVIRSAGFFLTIHNTQNNHAIERETITRLTKEASGLILYIQADELKNLDVLSKLAIDRVPVVLMDTQLDECDLPFVSCNNKKAFYDLAYELISRGHKKIAYVGSDSKAYYSAKCRYQGYCAALIEAGIPLNGNYIYDKFMPIEYLRDKKGSDMEKQHEIAADRAIEYFLSLNDPPTAIMAVNDKTAIHLMYAAVRKNVRVPEMLSITGFDNITESRYIPVPLTTADQQFKLLGEKAGKLVINQVFGSFLLETKHEVNAKIIITDSIGKR